MPDTIKDGTGSGSLASVTDDNRLNVSSRVGSRIYYESRDNANAFGVGTPILTATTNGGYMLCIKNTSATKNMVITDWRFNWDGGSTSHNKVAFATMYFGVSEPTANNIEGTAGVLNKSSNNTFDIVTQHWDEVGDGMVATGGHAGFNFIFAQGSTYMDTQGAIILGSNNSLTLFVRGEEVGETSMELLGFMEDY